MLGVGVVYGLWWFGSGLGMGFGSITRNTVSWVFILILMFSGWLHITAGSICVVSLSSIASVGSGSGSLLLAVVWAYVALLLFRVLSSGSVKVLGLH